MILILRIIFFTFILIPVNGFAQVQKNSLIKKADVIGATGEAYPVDLIKHEDIQLGGAGGADLAAVKIWGEKTENIIVQQRFVSSYNIQGNRVLEPGYFDSLTLSHWQKAVSKWKDLPIQEKANGYIVFKAKSFEIWLDEEDDSFPHFTPEMLSKAIEEDTFLNDQDKFYWKKISSRCFSNVPQNGCSPFVQYSDFRIMMKSSKTIVHQFKVLTDFGS